MDIQAEVVERARSGERAAIDQLVRATKDLVYNLAVRMLGNPADAEDATQEVLIKIITHLDAFRGDSAFRTWAYRVASNHLLTARKRGAEQRVESFDDMGEKLAANLADGDRPIEDQILLHEAKLICTSTMLACLDRDHRLAFILGEIFELPSDEAAAILEIGGDAFRKRLSRARERMTEFMGKTCGLVDEANACRCGKQAAHGIRVGFIDPSCLVWPRPQPERGRARLAELDGLSRALEIFRGHPRYTAPDALVERLQRALAAGGSDLLR
jgi:RNA polymerase sigma factor (sigma-70 family)